MSIVADRVKARVYPPAIRKDSSRLHEELVQKDGEMPQVQSDPITMAADRRAPQPSC
jgi:hypothetical protein